MHPCVAVVQKNEQPEDEALYSQELVILEGKELHVVKYTPDSIAFDFPQLTAMARSIGWQVITDWEVLDGRAFAVVERAISDPAEPAHSEPV